MRTGIAAFLLVACAVATLTDEHPCGYAFSGELYLASAAGGGDDHSVLSGVAFRTTHARSAHFERPIPPFPFLRKHLHTHVALIVARCETT